MWYFAMFVLGAVVCYGAFHWDKVLALVTYVKGLFQKKQ